MPSSRTGQHRLGRADRIHCREMPMVRELFAMRRPARRWLRSRYAGTPRHSFAFFQRRGQAARPAFVLIMSL